MGGNERDRERVIGEMRDDREMRDERDEGER